MALLHHATLSPTKPELLAAWLPSQPWAADLPGLAPFGGYRLDDPDGEVGLEGILLRSDAGDVRARPADLPRRAARRRRRTSCSAPRSTRRSAPAGCTTRSATRSGARPSPRRSSPAASARRSTSRWTASGRPASRRSRSPAAARAGGAVPADIEVVVVRRVGDQVDADAVLAGSWDGGSGVLAVVRIRRLTRDQLVGGHRVVPAGLAGQPGRGGRVAGGADDDVVRRAGDRERRPGGSRVGRAPGQRERRPPGSPRGRGAGGSRPPGPASAATSGPAGGRGRARRRGGAPATEIAETGSSRP